MKTEAGNKYPDSEAGVKEYIGDFGLKETYNLSGNLEIVPDPSVKNVWMVIDHGKKFGLLVNLTEDAEGGLPEVGYDQALPYSDKKKEGSIKALRRLSSSLRKTSSASISERWEWVHYYEGDEKGPRFDLNDYAFLSGRMKHKFQGIGQPPKGFTEIVDPNSGEVLYVTPEELKKIQSGETLPTN